MQPIVHRPFLFIVSLLQIRKVYTCFVDTVLPLTDAVFASDLPTSSFAHRVHRVVSEVLYYIFPVALKA